jgi:transcriptional regulator with XRE-family HTH domain
MKRSDYFASRVTHFLKGYRKKGNLTQSELADKLGTTKSTVSRIENNQDKQITFVLEILENLATLEKMDLGSFINYLDSNKVSSTESALYPWQRSVLAALQDTKQSLRLDFVTEVMSQNKEPLEAKLELLVKLNRLPASSFEVVNNLINELSKTKK